MKRIGMYRVDGRSFWFGGYFGRFDRDLMIEHAGQARADRFDETFDGRVPLPDAQLVSVYDEDRAAAEAFAATFNVDTAPTLDAFADGLDGVIVPFPAGGPARDYRVLQPLIEQGVPMFLDRIILEQADELRELIPQAIERGAAMHVTCFMRYLDTFLRCEHDPAAPVQWVVVTASGEPNGYGADLLDLVDELMGGPPISVINVGNPTRDVLRIQYDGGRHAMLQLLRDVSGPMVVAAGGEQWSRSLEIDGSRFHYGAMRQFEAFVAACQTRRPPVSYERVLANAAILAFAERRTFDEVHHLP